MHEITLSHLASIRESAAGHLIMAGTSMFPLLRPGDPIALCQLDRPPRVGDVVLIPSADRLLLHRVVEIRREAHTLVTRGDFNRASDPPTAIGSVIGHLAGHYDARRCCRMQLPLARRAWDRLMRMLVRVETRGLRPALVAAYGCELAMRSMAAMRPRRPS
jgi:hypothetical protein